MGRVAVGARQRAHGPVLGVTCFQWALSTTKAGIVQSIVATSPLATIPLAAWLEGGWPRPVYYGGAAARRRRGRRIVRVSLKAYTAGAENYQHRPFDNVHLL